jgi:hypothetical protein
MRRLIVALTAALALALAPVASAHPSNENRSDQSTFGGPHCHTNQQSGKPAYPSHRAHERTGTPVGVFAATPCPE